MGNLSVMSWRNFLLTYAKKNTLILQKKLQMRTQHSVFLPFAQGPHSQQDKLLLGGSRLGTYWLSRWLPLTIGNYGESNQWTMQSQDGVLSTMLIETSKPISP